MRPSSRQCGRADQVENHARAPGADLRNVRGSAGGWLLLGGVFKIVAFIVVLSMLGFVLAGLYLLGHGGNDAQKTIGILRLLFIGPSAAAATGPRPHGCVIRSCCLAIGAGALLVGWRTVKTMGQRVTKLKPVRGFCAEADEVMRLLVATALGIPVSTKHTVTGALAGVGAVRNASKVRWRAAGNIVWAWVLTTPASAVVAATFYCVSRRLAWNCGLRASRRIVPAAIRRSAAR
jgi:phosphate/sulfate permease